MTQQLHPETISSPGTTGTATPPAAGFFEEIPVDSSAHEIRARSRSSRAERESIWLERALAIDDFSHASIRELRVMANQLYRLIDADFPPAGATERYETIAEELRLRFPEATDRQTSERAQEVIRDNPLYCRFELYVDGLLAAYMKYTMLGGQINLTDGVEQPGFRDKGFDMVLMRHIMLNTHKRRLRVVPQCPSAFVFLADNPQYLTLAPHLKTTQH
ncbi:N-acetyltransferase [Arthrobacter sp. Br18]|uniref:GNAT family N-acetyltransferase n=1 Tax=Arthrobacter sp. Br18 TaxID=1312954 RepID=UPI0004AD28C3|nr:N-acetyltransferase [Arthrobacter sp. Br18]